VLLVLPQAIDLTLKSHKRKLSTRFADNVTQASLMMLIGCDPKARYFAMHESEFNIRIDRQIPSIGIHSGSGFFFVFFFVIASMALKSLHARLFIIKLCFRALSFVVNVVFVDVRQDFIACRQSCIILG